MQTKLILKLNTNNKIDLPKLTTLESTKMAKVKTVNSSNKVNKDKINGHEVKPKTKNTPPPKKVTLNFQDIYNNLYNNFPDVINMDNPLILPIDIHKKIARELGIDI